MAYRQTRERTKIKTGEDKSGVVSSLFIYPVRPAMRGESGDDAYQDSFRNGKIHFAIISNGVNPLRSILLYIKFIFPKGEDVNCKIRGL